MTDKSSKPRSKPALWQALVPIIALMILLAINVILFGEDSSYRPNQIALLVAAGLAACVGLMLSIPMREMLDGIKKSITSTLVAILILLLIGALAGTWMMSGIVPAMIYYGLDVLNPAYFLVAATLVCAIVSVVTGSSWSTIATVGIALLGIGNTLGIGMAPTAGAIISGAYFGDKISPLSDTTNLAAAMAGTDLITHIKYMLWTTVPSFLIACGIFLAIGLTGESEITSSSAAMLKEQIDLRFNLNPIIFVVPVLVLVMVFFKVDAVAALFVGAVAGGLIAVVFQPEMITTIAGLESKTVIEQDENGNDVEFTVHPSYAKRAYVAFINSMAGETKAISDDEKEALEKERSALQEELTQKRFESAQKDDPDLTLAAFKESNIVVDQSFAEVEEQIESVESQIAAASLLKGKGMAGMLNTIWLIITAMCFGGIMEACGLLRRITEPLVNLAQSRGSLVATTAGSCIFTNVTASDQYLAIVVPGQMFAETYEERGLAPENLSRTLEDAGTVTSVLVPWNTCGAAQSTVLGVSVFAFAPWCFFNLLSPVMTILFAYLGINIRTTDKKAKEIEPQQ